MPIRWQTKTSSPGSAPKAGVSGPDDTVFGPGLYVHVPFCARACDFCNFYQIAPDRRRMDRYLEGMRREAGMVEASAGFATWFWGGGTPGLLSAGDFERLGTLLRERFGPPRLEWTVETTPAVVTRERLRVMKDLGVTRLSIGVQTFQPRLLEALGRPFRPDAIYRAWDQVREAGFASVNLDLMFALPGQSLEDWKRDLAEAARLGPDHLSTYCLTLEEDTALYLRLLQQGRRPDPEEEIRFYRESPALLADLGYQRYEISNYARPGFRCLHNLNTWAMGDWLGLGPAAAGQWAGRRERNVADLEAWRTGLDGGERATEDRDPLAPGRLLQDCLIFGLRRTDGVDLAELERRFPFWRATDHDGLWQRLREGGWLESEAAAPGRLRLTSEGLLLA
ncbi:MAG: radical SAM family heme chaperone HemW, partial [Puniceicoccaceae bacterium]